MNRNERVEDHLARARDRRAARRDGRQGRQPAAQRRAERRRHDCPRSRSACCASRGSGCAPTPTRSTARRAFDVPGRRRALVHAHRRRRARVRPRRRRPSRASPALRGVTSVTTPDGTELAFREDATTACIVDARAVDRHPFGTRYVVFLRRRARRDRVVDRRREPGRARRAARGRGSRATSSSCRPGRYADEAFPLTVPAGVTLRGRGRARDGDRRGRQASRCVLGRRRGARARHGHRRRAGLHDDPADVRDRERRRRSASTDCHVESIMLSGRRRPRRREQRDRGRQGLVHGREPRRPCAATTSTGCAGARASSATAATGHVIEENECRDDLCAIRARRTAGARDRAQPLRDALVRHPSPRRAATRSLHRNQAWRTMRAVDVEGGVGQPRREPARRALRHRRGDRRRRGRDTVVADSWFHDCRVGVFVWGAGTPSSTNNAISEAARCTTDRRLADRARRRRLRSRVEHLLIALWRAPDADVADAAATRGRRWRSMPNDVQACT